MLCAAAHLLGYVSAISKEQYDELKDKGYSLNATVGAAGVEAAFEEYLIVTIWIPEGEQLALQTFNPKLGIQGGISVLGTTGIVKPMSEEALLETIRLEIHMKAVNGDRKSVV